MADVERLFKRLRREFIKVNVLQASLDALVLFLSANLVLFLFGTELFPSLPNITVLAVVALVFFVGDLAYRSRSYRLELYEERNPELREILRTARDNPEQDNLVSRAMVEDLMKRLRSITSDSIIPDRSIIKKILVVGALSFLTLLSGVTDFQIQEDGGSLLPGLDPGTLIDDDDEEEVLQNTSRIYGERDDIDASDMDLAFNITGEGENEQLEEDGSAFRSGEDAAIEASESQLSEDLALAKAYSLAVKELRNK